LSAPPDYSNSPGPENTNCVVGTVTKRVSAGGISAVVVASTSGLSALKFARALGAGSGANRVKVICVSEPPSYSEVVGRWPTIDSGRATELAQLGVRIVNDQPYVFHNSVTGERLAPVTPEKLLRSFLEKCFGSGMKVAIESILMATSAGAVPPFEAVIGVGGTHSGADTAIVARSTYTNRMLADDPSKCLTIMEILAMPRQKV